MYTQCSHCETVFQLTAETLRAAGGQVRCGRCGEVFNALARLAEDASAFAPPSESPLEMEARADEILHSPSPSRPVSAEHAGETEESTEGDVDFARLQLIDKLKLPREPAPPGTVPAPPPIPTRAPQAQPPIPPRAPQPQPKPDGTASAPGGNPAPRAAETPGAAPAAAGSVDTESMDEGELEFTLPPGELDRIFVDPSAPRAPPPTARPSADARPTTRSARTVNETAPAAPQRASGPELAEQVRDDLLAGLRQRPFEEPPAPADQRARLAWGAGAALLALVLVAQMIHENRTWLAVHGPLRGSLPGLYAMLGVKVQQPVSLSAYQLRQWGVTGDPSAAGTLRVRASVLNTSAQLQPYPLLRVTLANRFGTRIGTRDFDAAEYLGRPTVRMMTPGERADATLDIQDPGKEAEGFEIDVCLRGPDQSIACAADAASQAKP